MTINMDRFYGLRQRVFNLIRAVDEGYHKSYEGALDIVFSFPDVFTSNGNPEPPEYCRIKLYCYLLCNGRHEEFDGPTFDRCMDKLERWIDAKEDLNGLSGDHDA